MIRTITGAHGTLGILIVDGAIVAYTMEPPDKDNKPNLSCIPAGKYDCVWHKSPRYGWVYMVTKVSGRAWILSHPGNYGGDRAKGWKTHTLGCILLGKYRGVLGKQRAVLCSRPTVRKFTELMNKETFNLTITGVY